MKWSPLFACLTLALFVVAHAPAGDGEKDDFKKLQGNWKIVLCEARGTPVDKDKTKLVVFKGNKLMFENKEATFKINSKGKPKTIDLTGDFGDVNEMKGIYAFDGDELKL